jgi:phenylacetate-coenzyme A ligase PaaK-like adenylate-forming protein
VFVVVDGLFSCLGTSSGFHWSGLMSLFIKVLIHPKKKVIFIRKENGMIIFIQVSSYLCLLIRYKIKDISDFRMVVSLYENQRRRITIFN